MEFIPYACPEISEEDIEAVMAVLKTDWLTQGPTTRKFEESLANYCGSKYAVTVSNGTAGLHAACLALGVGVGDVVWTSPNTFVASANCVLYCGADVDFVDIDPKTYNLSVDALKEKLAQADKNGKLPKVVIPVHFAGQACDMAAIKQLADQYGFKIIEDASHAIGGKYRDTMVGACAYSDITIFSFHAVKVLASGEGGAALTNQPALAEKLQLLRTHCVTRDVNLMESESHGPWYYEQVDLGFNYRMTDIQSGLGLSQLSRLDNFLQRRRDLVDRYNNLLKESPVVTPYEADIQQAAWHLYVVCVDPNERKRIFEAMRAANIGVNVHYIPVHTQPYYQRLGFSWGDFPEAEKYYQSAITLPLFPGLMQEQQDYVVQQLQRNLVKEACYE